MYVLRFNPVLLPFPSLILICLNTNEPPKISGIPLTEIDFENFDESAKRRIFVGVTRATMTLIMIMSRRSKDIILKGIN